VTKGVRLESNGAYWTACWTTEDGARGRRTVGPKSELSKRKALDRCAEIMAELALEPGRRNVGRAPTLKSWGEDYMKLRGDLSEGTRAAHRLTIDYLREFFGDDRRLDRITRAAADNWRTWLGTNGDISLGGRRLAGQELAEPTVCLHVRNAKVIMGRAVDRAMLGVNPFAKLRATPPQIAPDFYPLTYQELDAILEACPDSAWRCAFSLARLAGLRFGEIRSLHWSHVDLGKGLITVLPPPNAKGRRTENTKKRARQVPISPKLSALLREAWEAAPSGEMGPCVGRFRLGTYSASAAKIIGSAGVPPYEKPFHTLRKCLETEWLDQHPVMTVCKWLGNSPAVAAQHYQTPTKDSIARVTGGKTETDLLREKIEVLEKQLAERAQSATN
jgi:integrase